MQLHSNAFEPGGELPTRYDHESGDISPPFHWTDVPVACNQLVITCTDPDAPGGTFTHWLLGNIEPNRDGIGEGETLAGAATGRNDFGDVGYGGPAPPAGQTHRYVFRLHALAEPLELKDGSSPEEFAEAIERSLLETAELEARYRRPS